MNENPDDVQCIIALSDNAPAVAIQPGFKGGKIAVWKAGGQDFVSAIPPAPKQWHYYSYTFDGKNHGLYIDGKLQDSSVATPQIGKLTKLEFGRWWGEGSKQYLKGLLSEVRIYNRALTEAEIKSLR